MPAFHRILVPVDGSDSAHRAFTAAVDLARRSGARVRLVHVLDELVYASGWRFATEVVESNRREARSMLERWGGTCARLVPVPVLVVRHPAAADRPPAGG